jgi:hypothetical protein
MNAKSNPRLTNWQETLAKLPWGAKYAQRSAKLALSKAAWLDINMNQAIQQVFERALGGFFQENPQIPFEAWQTVSDQTARPDHNQDTLLEWETAASSTI